MTQKNPDGQPVRPFPVNLIINHGKATDQIIGIAQGIMCDGVITDSEAEAFRRFVDVFCAQQECFPFDVLKSRLDRIFRDGVVDDDERQELKEIMRSLGGLVLGEPEEVATESSSLPFDVPLPEIIPTKEFVVTGKFAFGTRKRVEEQIKSLGGWTNSNPRRGTSYVVVGHFASRDWIHTSHGRKIERALELRQQGAEISIFGEEHWRTTLGC